MKALASLGHVEQMTAIEGNLLKIYLIKNCLSNIIISFISWWIHILAEYNNMKERLKRYLQKFAENKKVVREEDIKEFFSEMESKKRPKVVIPTYCRWNVLIEYYGNFSFLIETKSRCIANTITSNMFYFYIFRLLQSLVAWY